MTGQNITFLQCVSVDWTSKGYIAGKNVYKYEGKVRITGASQYTLKRYVIKWSLIQIAHADAEKCAFTQGQFIEAILP